MAGLLGQGVVHGQRELDGAVLLPAPPDRSTILFTVSLFESLITWAVNIKS